MATNGILIAQARKTVEMDLIATKLRALGATIPAEGMNQDIMVQASHLDDIMVTMCSELRRLCAEPYGTPQIAKHIPSRPADRG